MEINDDHTVEDILRPDISRYILYPIKYHDVRFYVYLLTQYKMLTVHALDMDHV